MRQTARRRMAPRRRSPTVIPGMPPRSSGVPSLQSGFYLPTFPCAWRQRSDLKTCSLCSGLRVAGSWRTGVVLTNSIGETQMTATTKIETAINLIGRASGSVALADFSVGYATTDTWFAALTAGTLLDGRALEQTIVIALDADCPLHRRCRRCVGTTAGNTPDGRRHIHDTACCARTSIHPCAQPLCGHRHSDGVRSGWWPAP
jgi:hypothetical protein